MPSPPHRGASLPRSPPPATAPPTTVSSPTHRTLPARARRSGSRRRSAPQHLPPTAASPEVINSLVESLAALQPSPLHNPHLYGTLADPSDLFPPALDTDTADTLFLPAAAPVVRTAPAPSHRRTGSETPPYTPAPAPPLPRARDPAPSRPASADSIDSAVLAYLAAPRLSRKLTLPGPRTVCFSDVGAPAGHPVFVCVGMGLTRYISTFYDDLARTLNLRLLTPDRPGVGDSSPVDEAARSVLAWPDDIAAICSALGITRFSLLAHSAGAVYALATALRMPHMLVGKLHLLAPWIPPSQLAAAVERSVPMPQRILRALPTPLLRAANASFMAAASASITAPGKTSKRAPPPRPVVGPPPDLGAVERERRRSYDSRLIAQIWALATRNANPAVDLLVCLERYRPVGFRYVDITREVVIHHGAKDARVPVENVRWLGEVMRRCEVRVLEGEGHGLMASAGVMGGVLEEMAGEWRGWRRQGGREYVEGADQGAE